MQDPVLFSCVLLRQPSILRRLQDEFTGACRDFQQSPKAFITSALKGQGVGGQRRKTLLQFGLAIGILTYAVGFLLALIFWSMSLRPAVAVEDGDPPWIPLAFPQPLEAPKAKEDAGGGGGGGRKTLTPPSAGEIPLHSLIQPVVAPRPEPQTHKPALPTIETVLADPNLQLKRDEFAPTGLPEGVVSPPSAGPGEDGGVGSGEKGGMGPGKGKGVGPYAPS